MGCSGVGFLNSAFQLFVWVRMHLWGNRGFGLCMLRLMSSSDSATVLYELCVVIEDVSLKRDEE